MVDLMEETDRLLCIGDIHGCARELERLLDRIAPGSKDRLVFLGDYIDRGGDSAAVVERMTQLRRELPRTIFLRGNHEEMLLGFLGRDGSRPDIFLRAGGAATLRSYGVDPDRSKPADFLKALPSAHLHFLEEGLSLSYAEGPFIFVHAGVRAGVPLDQQSREDLLWIRDEFLASEHGFPQTVIFGHTPQRRALFSPRRWIAMDSGCVYGGYLSCLDLTAGEIYEIKRGADVAESRSVREELKRAGVLAERNSSS